MASSPPHKRQRLGNSSLDEKFDQEGSVGEEVITPDQIAFCCATCTCGVKTPIRDKNDLLYSEGVGLPHRKCCGTCGTQKDKNKKGIIWISALDKACKESIFISDPIRRSDTMMKKCKKSDLQSRAETADNLEIQYGNTACNVTTMSQLKVCPDYVQASQKMEEIQNMYLKDSFDERFVVLDLYAGIGTGLVVLKRLGIHISKYIYVDQDKVARHVFRTNHDFTYYCNGERKTIRDDGINYVFKYEKFKDIYHDIDTFMEEHGRKYCIINTLL